jgi:hypothetical protein
MKTNQNEVNCSCSIDELVTILDSYNPTKVWRKNLKIMIPKIYPVLFDCEIPVKYRVDEHPPIADLLLSVKTYEKEIGLEFDGDIYPLYEKAYDKKIGLEFEGDIYPAEPDNPNTIILWMNREEFIRFINNFMKSCDKVFPE